MKKCIFKNNNNIIYLYNQYLVLNNYFYIIVSLSRFFHAHHEIDHV
jgi:hypothetical protein